MLKINRSDHRICMPRFITRWASHPIPKSTIFKAGLCLFAGAKSSKMFCKNIHKPAYKPGSVSRLKRQDDSHLSRRTVTRTLERPTRRSNGPDQSFLLIWPCSRWGLPSQPVARLLVGSYIKEFAFPAISPLPFWGGIFLLHFPYPYATHNKACYFGRWELPTTVSYGARTFLSRFFKAAATIQPACE